MTNEEAIERLVCDKFILLCAAKHPDEVNLDEINIAKAAIEKQISKKPNNIGIIGVSIKVGACPLCSEGCNYAMAYCDKCGQALDWSE